MSPYRRLRSSGRNPQTIITNAGTCSVAGLWKLVRAVSDSVIGCHGNFDAEENPYSVHNSNRGMDATREVGGDCHV